MYEEMAAPLSDVMVDAYLERLGLARDTLAFEQHGPLQVLNTLIWAHQSAIPFETLDIAGGNGGDGSSYGGDSDGSGYGNRNSGASAGGADLSLATTALFDKLITHQRGGYCFELNGLFQRLLEALGFDVRAHLARAVINRDYLPPRLHRMMTVCLSSGNGGDKRSGGRAECERTPATYLCDVGFGGPMPGSALPLYEGTHTDVTGTQFQLLLGAATGEPPSTWLLSRVLEDTHHAHLAEAALHAERSLPVHHALREHHHPGPATTPKLQRLITFTTEAQSEVDFITPHYYCSHAPDSHFVLNVIANIRTPHGFAHILNNSFKLIENGKTIIDRAIESPADLQILLQAHFGIIR